jgi:hypothetical protein
MDDTSPEITEKTHEMIRAKSPLERFNMGCSMYEISKQMVIAGILHEQPGISKAALRREVFLRFYGEDFDQETRDKILKHLDSLGG